MNDSAIPLPPPTFEFLVYSLKARAELRLGLFPLPGAESEDMEPDLPSARHAIDMLAMLVDKTRGNLSVEEQRLIENSLTELRFRFVHISEQTAKEKAEKEKAASEKANAAQAPGESPASS
jgi:hypothetical protein